jgi:hypothetical protein
MDGSLRILLAEEGADDERLQTLTGYLRDELREVDGVEPMLLRNAESPDGSRALDVIAVGGLVIKLLDSTAIRTVVGAIRNWLGRGAGAPRTVHIEIGGDSIDLSAATTADQERLVEMFVSRHTAQGGASWQASAEP